MKRSTRKKEEMQQTSPLDQANLDLGFIEAFVDMLWGLSENKGTLEIRTGTVSALCYEARFKIDSLNKFLADIPIDTEGNMYGIPKKELNKLRPAKQ